MVIMRRFLAIAVFILLFAACSSQQRVVIISTNDIHSSIEGFPHLATLVEDIRAAEGADNVLLADAGDRWTGNPFVDIGERPLMPIVELMNEIGYDVATFGNHEFDWGQPLLKERIAEMNFPVVCANIVSDGSELGPVAPYVYIERDGLRFAFLGLVTNFTRWERPEGKAEHFEGLTFPDVYGTAARYASLSDSCDVFVGLTHIGNDVDLILPESMPAFDLIIGGHSHTEVIDPPVIGQTLVTQTGSKLKYAGITTITRKGGKRGKIVIENRLVKLDTIAPSPRVAEMVKGYLSDSTLLSPIGSIGEPFDEAGVENLVVDVVRGSVKADIALYHKGGIRIDTLYGTVSTADLFSIEPFMSEIYTLHMTPGQVKGLIMNKFNDANPNESHAPDLVPSGFAYTITTDEAGEATDVVFDRPERSRYLVAMPDYVYKNYIFDRSEDAQETGIQVTDVLHSHITALSPLQPDATPRITIE